MVPDTLIAISDTISHVADTIASTGIVEDVATSAGSSGKTGLTIAIMGLLVFAAHLFSEIFSRKRIPDVLLLMMIGLLIGPIFHWISPDNFGVVGSVFSAITLVIILFESGTQLSFETLMNSLRGTVKLTLTNFFATVTIIGILGSVIFKVNPLVSIMLGSIVGGTSSAVVIPMVSKLKVSSKGGTILILESAFGAVLCIVFALAFLQALELGKLDFGTIFGQVFSSFVLATIIGLAGSIFWSYILERVRHFKNSILTTPAFVFIVYGINEFLGYSGAIAALAFGIGLANIDSIYDSMLKPIFKKKPSSLNPTEKMLFSEIVFLMKTFFFVYVGISIRLDDLHSIMIGLCIAVILFIIRIPIVRFMIGTKKENIPSGDLLYMSSMTPKGLASAVLATMPAVAALPLGDEIKNIVFAVILFTIVFTSIMVPIMEKDNLISKLYSKLLGITRETQDGDVVDETGMACDSEIVADAIDVSLGKEPGGLPDDAPDSYSSTDDIENENKNGKKE